MLADAPVELPVTERANTHVFAQYTIRVKQRDKLQAYLASYGIPTAIHYPKVINHQKPYIECRNDNGCKTAVDASETVLSLPMHAYLTDSEVSFICDKINDFYKR